MTIQTLKRQIIDVIGPELGPSFDAGRFDVGYSSNPAFGDIATNAAMVFAKDLGRVPRELASELAAKLAAVHKAFAKVEVAGPGFINITLSDEALGALALAAPRTKPSTFLGQKVVTEYSDPNPFKVLHVGHLYTSVVGDAITRLIESTGAKVHPVNFGGDVGLHVGKTLWVILQELGGPNAEGLEAISPSQRADWMVSCYIKGEKAYNEDSEAKAAIDSLNKQVYEFHASDDRESPVAKIYWTCRTWSYEYFNQFYDQIGTHFEKYYPESSTAPIGLQTVREQAEKGVYTYSDGAVVFAGEPYGLHTRVFVTSNGLPTYEAKDVGLIMAKWRDYHFDFSVVITGNDITEYMKVVLKSVEQYRPELVARTRHIVHGNVKLSGGVKMSSRKGNFLKATDVLDMAAAASQAATGKSDEKVVLGAVKYAFLKQRIGADIIFVPEESVSLEGNSGPYLQYAHARARSILAKAGPVAGDFQDRFGEGERMLARKLIEYPDAVSKAVDELMPHYICTYLYELAQAFNRFYENNRVIGDEREGIRAQLVNLYADVLRDGLGLLNIDAPDRL